MHISSITNDTWRVEAEMVSTTGDAVVVELRLSSALTGDLPAISIGLERDDAMSKADYEAQALIMLAESAGQLESACVGEAVRKGS